VLVDEFKLRGVAGQPYPIEAPLVKAVREWEDEFLGFAGISREAS
jgi:hypothetical protein